MYKRQFASETETGDRDARQETARRSLPRTSSVSCRARKAPVFSVKKMNTFSDEDCETLIELIRQHPPIYDARLDSYRNENLKDNIWMSIAESINKTGELFLLFLINI